MMLHVEKIDRAALNLLRRLQKRQAEQQAREDALEEAARQVVKILLRKLAAAALHQGPASPAEGSVTP